MVVGRSKRSFRYILTEEFSSADSLVQGGVQEGPSLQDVLEPRALSEAISSLSQQVFKLLKEENPFAC